eukprot:38596_1
MDMLNNDNAPRDREASVSISYEGNSDIVFEDLLGPLQKIEPSNVNTKNKTHLNNNNNNKEPTIEELFDDIFAPSIEESEKTSLFSDNEDEESEGYDPNNTTFTMPVENDNNNTDVLDSIFQDLDEKTKELNEQKQQKKYKQKKPAKPALIPQQPMDNGNETDISENEKLRLDKWEFDDGNVRRNIRVLLSTLHLALPECLEHLWTPINMSNVLSDNNVKKQYRKAIRITHPDKSIGRGDNT